MKNKMIFLALFLIFGALAIWSYNQTPTSKCPCNLPKIGEMISIEKGKNETTVESEIQLIAKAKQLRRLLELEGNTELNIDWESEIRRATETRYTQEFHQWYKRRRLDICSLKELICEEESKENPDEDFLKDTKYKLVSFILELDETKESKPHFSSTSQQKIDAFYQNAHEMAADMEYQIDQITDELAYQKVRLHLTKLRVTVTYFDARINDHRFDESHLDTAIKDANRKLNSIHKKFTKIFPS